MSDKRMIDEEKNKKTIRVRIYGKEYSIKSLKDAEYVQEIARYVDSKMTDVDRGGNYPNPVQVAVLAMMNISDELFLERKEKEELLEKLEERYQEISERISSVLQP